MMPVWEIGWQKRVSARVTAHGYASVTAFIEAHPVSTMLDLADMLGQDVAPSHLVLLYRAEAGNDPARYEAFARSCLARRILRTMREGWG